MGQKTVTEQFTELYGDFLELKVDPTLLQDVGMGGMTIVSANSDAFRLEPSVAGRSVSIIPPKDNGIDEIGVVRQFIGLAFMSRILDNPLLGYHELALLKNSMLAQAAKHFNFHSITGQYQWTFKLPNGKFCKDLEELAGYELRLYICRPKPLEKLDTDNIEISRRKE